MSQFMESDLPQVVILQDQLKMLRHIIRPDWLPEIIHIDIFYYDYDESKLEDGQLLLTKYLKPESSLGLQTSLDKGTQRKTTENELPSLTQCTA